jgi:hypothetical protein
MVRALSNLGSIRKRNLAYLEVIVDRVSLRSQSCSDRLRPVVMSGSWDEAEHIIPMK